MVGDNSFWVNFLLEVDDVIFSLVDDIKSGKGDLLINGKLIYKDLFKIFIYGFFLIDGSMMVIVKIDFLWGK